MTTIVSEVLTQLEAYEKKLKLRKRARKSRDRQIFEQTVTALVCDLTHRYISEPDGSLSIRLSHDTKEISRYLSPVFGSKLSDTLKYLSSPEMSFLELNIGKKSSDFLNGKTVDTSKLTTIRAGTKLISRIEKYDIQPTHLSKRDNSEPIVLKDSKDWSGGTSKLIGYEDTAITIQYRKDMRTINDWLQQSDIIVQRIGVDGRDRYLKRYFTEANFEKCGRLFGGFWQNMSPEIRRKCILIDHENVSELDFGQSTLRILYGDNNMAPPDGDLYEIPILKVLFGGKGDHREAVKKLITSALFADKIQSRMPKDTRQFIPKKYKYDEVMKRITAHHKSISHLFYKGLGMNLMFKESEVIVAVLLALKIKDIVALPIHDSILVPSSRSSDAIAVMEHTYRNIYGIEPTIDVK